MIRNPIRRMLIAAALLLPMLLFFNMASAQNGPIDTIDVITLDDSAFPDVTLRVRPLTVDGNALSGLTEAQIAVYEDGQRVNPLVVTAAEPVPHYVAFLVDLGQYINYRTYGSETIRGLIEQYAVNEHFVDGIDQIAIYGTNPDELDDTQLLLDWTSDVDTFRAAATALPLNSTGGIDTVASLRRVFESLTGRPGAENAALTLIYLGAYIDSGGRGQTSYVIPGVTALATDMRTAGVRTFAIHTWNDGAAALDLLVEGADGLKATLETDTDNASRVEALYEAATTRTNTYQLDYRSTSGSSDTRTVAVVPAVAQPAQANDPVQYRIALQPPVVTITSPADDLTVTRTASFTDANELRYDTDSFEIVAALGDWPDGFDRSVVLVELLINGESAGPSFQIQNPNNNTFRFNIPLTEYRDDSDSATFGYEVRVRDEFGLTGTSETANIAITVNVPEDAVVTIVATPTQGPTPTPVVVIETACVRNPDSPECTEERVRTYAPYAIIAALVLALIVTVFFFRRQLASAGQRVGEVATGFLTEVSKTLLGGSGGRRGKPIAHIDVIAARDDLKGQTIDIYNHTTSFGRDPKLSDIQLFDSDDKSSVSGLHATLQYEKAVNQFMIIDSNSSVGTSVNGTPLTPNMPHVLQDGDEIMLGDMFRRGAKLRFRPAVAGTQTELMGMDPSKTRIVNAQGVETRTGIDRNATQVIPDPGATKVLKDVNATRPIRGAGGNTVVLDSQGNPTQVGADPLAPPDDFSLKPPDAQRDADNKDWLSDLE